MHLEDTEIYKHLKAKDIEDIVTSILKNNIEQKFVPLLNSIKIRMPEYTSHDEIHSINVLKNMWHIIPQKTKDNLSLVELVLLIYSAYLHDMGMLITDQDIKNIINSTEYQDFKYAHIHDYEGNNDNTGIIKDYVRINHGHRSELYIESIKDIFTIYGINYASILKRICGGHTLNVDEINDYNENSRIADNCVNEKYLTIILRIADLLDLYPNRTPYVIYEKIKPNNEISIQEWEKHLSITGWEINDTFVEIHAECSEYNTERTLRDFIKYINKEIKDSFLCLGYKNDKYFFNLKGDISVENIRSDGSYIYNELKFNLNTSNIISLLMGDRLYSRPEFALRELIQNAADAVLYRKELEQINSTDINYSPKISINLDNNVLTITDNGIGMDINIFKKYFMNIGKSYYKSTEATEKVRNYTSISEFGIGILSTFMVADNISIESKLRPKDLNKTSIPILIDIPTIDEYFIQRKSRKQSYGTKITLNLKEKHPFKNTDLAKFIKDCAPLISPCINIEVNNKLINTCKDNNFYNSLINFKKCKIHHVFDIASPKYGVEGRIFLIKEQEEYVRCESIVAKNGFKVNCAELIPNWANIKAVLNITNSNIKLSANRESFIINEDFKNLKRYIEAEIENKIYEYLLSLKNTLTEDEYVEVLYELVYSKVLFNFGYRNENKTIPSKIQDLILLPVIDVNGKRQYKNVKDLLLLKNIITHTRVPHKYKDKFKIPYAEIFNSLKEYSLSNILLVNNSKINSYSTQVILSSLGLFVDKIITTSINGFNIFVLSKNNSNMPYKLYWNCNNFGRNIHTLKHKKVLFIQLAPSEFVLGYPDKLFNSEHELIHPYLSVDKINDAYSIGEIRKAFDEFAKQIDKSFNMLIFQNKGTKCHDIKKSYLRELNCLSKNLWKKYEEYNLIPQKTKLNRITEKDFPNGIIVKVI